MSSRSPTEAAGRTWRPRSVRARTTLAATALVVAAIALGTWGLVSVLGRDLAANLRHTALVRAIDLAAILQNGGPAAQVAAGVGGDSLVQIISPGGRVLASSADISGEAPLVATFPPPGVVRSQDVPEVPAGAGPYTVVTLGVRTAQGDVAVVVAQSQAQLPASVAAVSGAALLGFPLLAVVVAGVGWFSVGRALRPVELIRQRVASIGPHARGTRVPDPGTDDEIGRLARTMNDMLARLDAAGEVQRRFVSDASHELRSPIAGIRAHLEVADTYGPQALDRQLGQVLLAETTRLEHLVNDLLLLAKMDEGAAPRLADVDLDDLVFAAAHRLRVRGRVTVDTTGVRPVRTRGEEAQIRRALSNLADNAERHAAGNVRFSCRADGGACVIRVSDDGAGIPPDQREIIFQRFVRLDDGRTRDAGGVGLGLALVADVARAHGGSARVVETPAGWSGACLELVLGGLQGEDRD